LKSGSLNLLELSGPVQACSGIALPLPLPLLSYRDAYIRIYGNCRVVKEVIIILIAKATQDNTFRITVKWDEETSVDLGRYRRRRVVFV
jgi:hypothetical protein